MHLTDTICVETTLFVESRRGEMSFHVLEVHARHVPRLTVHTRHHQTFQGIFGTYERSVTTVSVFYSII